MEMSNIDVVQEREKRQQRIMTDAFLDALEELEALESPTITGVT